MHAAGSGVDVTSGEDPPPVVSLDGALDADLAPRILACVAALLKRYTDRSKLLIGFERAPDAPLTRLELDLGSDPSFLALVGQVESALAAQTSRDRDDGGELDVAVSFGGQPPADTAIPWLTVSPGADAPELTLHAPGDGLLAPPISELCQHLRTMLDATQTRAQEPISALPLMSPSERERLLVDWNQTAADYPPRCLHELIAEQTERAPEAVAIECGDERLTYRELEMRANQLANHLAGLGVRPGVLVGICVERSLEMLVGLLGIMKAGGAYVPIDPAYPAERQAFMLESSEAPIVLTQEQLLDALPAGEFKVVCLDRDWPQIAALASEAPAGDSDTERLAYVIYTSGSTGKPKGVQISHRALVNFLWTMRERPGMDAQDVLVAVTTLSFDIAGLELYLPLVLGARIVLARAETTNPRALAGLLDQVGATVMQATPTTWRMLLDSGWQGRAGLKALCGGEALPLSLADGLVGLGLELWNMYGPTETTIWSTCKRVDSRGETLTIGRPIANTTIYILDQHMQPVPVGVAGELWIGGDGLAHGYRGRPDLTEERFVAHPFQTSGDARIYRTGDLARYRPDMEIEFLGRIDHQVKVRGFRIELGEIETCLTRHPAVREAVVVARGQESTEAELAAYVVPSGVPVGADALRRFLMQTLPAYMVPSTVTVLSSFPLTPNGKIDRKALPEPQRSREGQAEPVAPRSELERRLATIWERELDIHPIGVQDDFFDLGVTSLAAATLFAAIEHELGNRLPLGAIFRAPTIEALAQLIGDAGAVSRWTSLIPIQPEGTRPPIFCVHGGAGTILHLAPLARLLGSEQPFYGLQSRGLYGGSRPLRTVEEMATHYISEMRQVHQGGPWRLAGYCFGAIPAFEMARRLTAEGEEVELLAFFNGPSPAWVKRWGWYGRQPTWQARHPKPAPPTKQEHRRQSLASAAHRIRRALREPHRFVSATRRHLRRPYTTLALALGRPVPERFREHHFFELHAKAERAYEPSIYDGEALVFYGEGLYEDPLLGWEGLAAAGIRSYAVPGEHDNNRQAMMEPGVEFVGEQLREYLADREADSTPASTTGKPSI
jgi:amino acid adenylation domain-containing protein